MNLRDLKYLVALADFGHFSKAAQACFVSQPALSIQLKKLEESLGVQLIERTNKSVVLTGIGNEIVAQARDILSRVESLRETAQEARDPYSGSLYLGVIPTLAHYLLPRLILKLIKKFPKLTLYLIEEKTEPLLDKLKQAKLDVGLLALPTESSCVAIPLFAEDFLVAMSSRHPLAKRKQITLPELKNEKLLLLESGHCLREQVLAVCRDANASFVKGFQATSLETLRQMVMAGVGITFMPKLACRDEEGVRYVPFSDPAPARTIRWIYRASHPRRKLLEEIAAYIKQLLAEMNRGASSSPVFPIKVL